uniref:Uncharacterized protein n=1 Tax=viral metagenome TaxID=1070528 RepID=A0A6C0AHY9_9ZZZZ
MVFPTDGRNHHSGVKAEKDIVDYLNSHVPSFLIPLYGEDIVFRHRGGTQTVSDIDIVKNDEVVASISVKNHQKGTIDYINTTAVKAYFDDTDIKDSLKKIKDEVKTVEEARPLVTRILQDKLMSINSDQIKGIIETCTLRSPKWMLIRAAGKMHMFPHSEIDAFRIQEGDKFELRQMRAKGSAKIWRIRGTVEKDTTLRLRYVLNNGVGALLGQSTKNKTSCPSIKIQQDAVKALLLTVKAVIL